VSLKSPWPKPPALRFNSHQDALDFATHCAENSQRLATFDPRFAVVEGYAEGKSVCTAKVSATGMEDFDLVVFRHPIVMEEHDDPAQMHLQTIRGNWHQKGVLPGITKPVKVPEGYIPSLVRLKRPDDTLDFERGIFAATVNDVGEFAGLVRESEMSGLLYGSIAHDTRGVDTVIKHGAHVVEDVKDDTGNFVKECLQKFDLVSVVSSFEISLNNVGALFVTRECPDPRLKISKMIFCPL
jgi:hypothetical protein